MDAELKLNKILSEIQKLGKAEQTSLLKRLMLLISHENQPKKKVTLSDLRSVGAEVWKDIDIDKYVDDERQW